MNSEAFVKDRTEVERIYPLKAGNPAKANLNIIVSLSSTYPTVKPTLFSYSFPLLISLAAVMLYLRLLFDDQGSISIQQSQCTY